MKVLFGIRNYIEGNCHARTGKSTWIWSQSDSRLALGKEGCAMSQTGSAVAVAMRQQDLFCPCCESEGVWLSFRKNGADYYECGSCDLTFILPRPRSEDLRKHYEEYGREYYSQ